MIGLDVDNLECLCSIMDWFRCNTNTWFVLTSQSAFAHVVWILDQHYDLKLQLGPLLNLKSLVPNLGGPGINWNLLTPQ